ILEVVERPLQLIVVRIAIKKAARRILEGNAFQHAAPSERDHRFAARQGFYGGHAEIFLTRENKRAAPRIEIAQRFARNRPRKFYTRSRGRFQLSILRSVPRDNQPPP